jgi:hypothetical protein
MPEAAMQLDASSERLANAGRDKREASTAPAGRARIGQYAFWLLIVVIVSARMLYHPAPTAFEVGNVTDPKHTIAR